MDHIREPVDERERARAASDLTRSFCVEAGAGTGKTSLLVRRFISIVESGKARAPEIVAITFTEKAAGEMKLRIRSEIQRLLEGCDLSPERRERLEKALREVESAPVSTIHSFASSILREHPIEAGIDPDFRQLDDLEGSLFFEELWSEFLFTGSRQFQDTLEHFLALGGSVEGLFEMARTVYDKRGSRVRSGLFEALGKEEDLSGFYPARSAGVENSYGHAGARALEEKSVEQAAEQILELVDKLYSIAEKECIDHADKGYLAIEQLAKDMSSLRALRGVSLEREILSIKIPTGKGRKSNWSSPQYCEEQKKIFEELKEIQRNLKLRISDSIAFGLQRLFDSFLQFADERKDAIGVLDFDDLLIRVRSLCLDSKVLKSLRKRYRYILVDEFQDTDPLQAEIIYLLCGSDPEQTPSSDGAEHKTGTSASHTVSLEPGKLFVVGDPKQSIYRFRRADIEIYEMVKEAILAGGGERLSIVQNFRSVPGVVAWVNKTFSAAMQPSSESRYQPHYEAIEAAREGEGPAVIALDLELGNENVTSNEVRVREGQAIARLIKHLLSSGTQVWNPATKQAEKISPGHIAVIYPATTGIEEYEEPLKEEGIPYIIEGGRLYYSREEIRALAAAIWSIEDPYDSLALVAALRSPIFGSSDEELFLFSRSGGRFDYIDPGSEAVQKFPALSKAFAVLRELHFARNILGPAAVMKELLRQSDFLELSLLRPHGDQRLANIRKAVAAARTFTAGGGSFRRFARWFREQESLAPEESESPLVEEDEDAVRLITIHKVKGLQFPIVILANLVQKPRKREKVLVGDGGRLAFEIGDTLETSDFSEFYCREQDREIAERIRLLYVAATRAADMLVIPLTPKKGNFFDIIAPGLPKERNALLSLWKLSSMPKLEVRKHPLNYLSTKKAQEAESGTIAFDGWLSRRKALIERGSRSIPLVAPSRLLYEQSVGDRISQLHDSGKRKKRSEAASFGEAFHRVMELLDLDNPKDLGRLCAIVASWFDIKRDLSLLESMAERVLKCETMERASRATKRLREVPFVLPLDSGFVRGRMDLLFEESGGWTVVDFKTDDISPEELDARVAAYRAQAGLYALALERLGIKSSGSIVLIFGKPMIEKSVRVTPELLSEALSSLETATGGGFS